MKDIFSYIVLEKEASLYLTFGDSDEELKKNRSKYLGKTVLFTDRHDFMDEEIVCAYRLCCLLLKELKDNGIETSIDRLMDEISGIKRVETFFDSFEKPQKVRSLTRGNELAQQVKKYIS